MKPLAKFSTLTLPLAALLIISGPTAASDRWFKVELLIFQQASSAAASSEGWDYKPTLQYPENYRFLRDAQQIAQNLHKQTIANPTIEVESLVSPLGIQTIVLKNPAAAYAVDDPTDIPRQSPALDPESPIAAAEAPQPAAEPEAPILPTPFTALPASSLAFRGKAAYMQRSGGYRILFHQNWVQPVASESRAIPIVIDRSGDLQDWPELQGSVKVYLSRFLHIETNLWLNTMGAYLPRQWQMPAPPLGPASLIIEEGKPLYYPHEEVVPSDSDVDLPAPVSAEEVLAEPQPLYPWRHAVALEQKRKMRSTEVHYIDHPMMGAVVLISPVTEEELLALAQEELSETPQ